MLALSNVDHTPLDVKWETEIAQQTWDFTKADYLTQSLFG